MRFLLQCAHWLAARMSGISPQSSRWSSYNHVHNPHDCDNILLRTMCAPAGGADERRLAAVVLVVHVRAGRQQPQHQRLAVGGRGAEQRRLARVVDGVHRRARRQQHRRHGRVGGQVQRRRAGGIAHIQLRAKRGKVKFLLSGRANLIFAALIQVWLLVVASGGIAHVQLQATTKGHRFKVVQGELIQQAAVTPPA